MPILVVCPACGTKLNAPDSGAGKRVRCPKAGCGALVPVPEPVEAEEVEVVDAEPAPKPVRAAVADDDDDDRPRKRRREDEDDEDDRPRRRRRRDDEDEDDRPRRRRRRSGGNRGKLIAFVVGGLLLLGGVGAGIYFLVLGKTSPPSGWKEYTYAEGGFKAYFPQEPTRSRGGIIGTEVSGDPINYATLFSENGLNLYIVVSAAPLGPQESPSVAREAVYKRVEEMSKKHVPESRVIALRSITWMGYPARELRVGASRDTKGPNAEAVTRFVVTDTHEFHATISSDDGRKPTSRIVNGFFDNIVPLK